MSEQKLSRQEKRQMAKRQKQMQSIGIMIIGLLIIVGGFVVISLNGAKVDVPETLSYTMTDGNAIGNPDAPVVIEEFSSFLCSHCRNFAIDTFDQLIEDYVYTGQVYFISRSFADPLGDAGVAAQAAYCAGDQGKYFEMKHVIYSNFNSIGYTQKELEAMAEAVDLNMADFKDCLSSGTYVSQVDGDLSAGTQAGITGTPSFLINGQLTIVGNREYAFFQQQIETALQTAGN